MNWLPRHRSHDYSHLTDRWTRVAKKTGMEMRAFAQAGASSVFVLRSRAAHSDAPVFYISAGVHGDEPAGACGLLAWAEQNLALLRRAPLLLMPCLNPFGLLMNTRTDQRGLDINRRFHMEEDEICGPWHREIAHSRIAAALCLHEDYDAEGLYIYELSHHRDPVSFEILKDCASVVQVDPRKTIDGRSVRRGVIRRRKIPQDLPGLPEAIVLHLNGCPITLTFETPSEFSLDARIEAHKAFIDSAFKHLAAPAGFFLS